MFRPLSIDNKTIFTVQSKLTDNMLPYKWSMMPLFPRKCEGFILLTEV